MKVTNQPANDLWIFEKRMLAVFELERKKYDGHCKAFEPAIKIGLTNDLTWWAEIYSYLVDYTPSGGRHHLFEAGSYPELIEKIDKAIKQFEK